MAEDLNDINIIDKYLNGELNKAEEKLFKDRYLNDAGFKKEVEIFRKIYLGVEQAGQQGLKKRIDGYYDEYIEENLTIEGNDQRDNIRPINWRKRVYIISGIAASVCLVTIAYFSVPVNNVANHYAATRTNNKKTKDTIKGHINDQIARIEKNHQLKSAKIPDSVLKGQVKSTTAYSYGFTGEVELAASSIRTASYPQPLSYIFNNGVLKLYGDPLLGLLNLDVYKKADQYYMICNGITYSLLRTATVRPLIKMPVNINGESINTNEKIQIRIEPINSIVYNTPPFGVVLSKDKGGNTYYFAKQKNKLMLVLHGNFNPDSCSLLYLKKDGVSNWYVLNGQQVYGIYQFPDKPEELGELSGINNEVPRLLVERGIVTKNVLSFNK